MLFGVERQKRRGCLEVHDCTNTVTKASFYSFSFTLLAYLPSVSYPTNFVNTQQLHCIKNVYKKLWSIWRPGDILHCYFKASACRHKLFIWLHHFSVAFGYKDGKIPVWLVLARQWFTFGFPKLEECLVTSSVSTFECTEVLLKVQEIAPKLCLSSWIINHQYYLAKSA